MRRTITLILVATMVAGCAHKDLKPPCTNVAALAAGTVPCDQREPVNLRFVPSTFAQ